MTVHEIIKDEQFLIFSREADERGVAVEFARLPKDLYGIDRDTTPEENERAESLLRIWFNSPRVIDDVVERLLAAKERFK